jgi:hypothetical protein
MSLSLEIKAPASLLSALSLSLHILLACSKSRNPAAHFGRPALGSSAIRCKQLRAVLIDKMSLNKCHFVPRLKHLLHRYLMLHRGGEWNQGAHVAMSCLLIQHTDTSPSLGVLFFYRRKQRTFPDTPEETWTWPWVCTNHHRVHSLGRWQSRQKFWFWVHIKPLSLIFLGGGCFCFCFCFCFEKPVSAAG